MLDMPPIPTASDLQARLAQTREQFAAELQAKERERAELVASTNEALARIDGDLATLRNVVSALEGKQAKPSKPKRQSPQQTLTERKNATGMGISMPRVQEAVEVIDALLEDKGGKTFTQSEFYSRMGWDQGRGSACVRYLRSIGYLRKAGKGGLKGTADLWAIMDREALSREIAKKQEEDSAD